MMQVQQIALDRALKSLDVLGAQYRVILPDGSSYGTLEVMPERKRAARSFEYGEITAYFLSQVESMQPGDCISISGDKFGPEQVRKTISAWAARHWGPGSVITSVTREANIVEVLRVS
jgi:hypothetical protein